jgi:hypothetical protein
LPEAIQIKRLFTTLNSNVKNKKRDNENAAEDEQRKRQRTDSSEEGVFIVAEGIVMRNAKHIQADKWLVGKAKVNRKIREVQLTKPFGLSGLEFRLAATNCLTAAKR